MINLNRPRARARVEMEPKDPAPSATLEVLAARVARLYLSWTDPEAFHLEKFTVASELRRLARELRRAA